MIAYFISISIIIVGAVFTTIFLWIIVKGWFVGDLISSVLADLLTILQQL
jgi:hypothetical protein